MITVKQLNEKLQSDLNANALGLTFNIFVDTGEYKEAVRRYNTVEEIVNGITSVISSDVQKTNDGIVVATMSLKTDLLFRCKDTEEDVVYNQETENGIVEERKQGNNSFLESVRNFLDGYSQETSYTLISDEESNEFDVSVALSYSMSSNRTQLPGVGDSIKFTLYSYFNIIQNGDNSLRHQFYLDGERLPYLLATPRRTPTPELDVYANTLDGSAKATISNTVWGLTVKCSSLVGKFSKAIKNFILNGERNVAHILEQRLGDEEKINLVFLGDASTSAQGVLNAGLDVAFAEAVDDYELLSFPKTFYIWQCPNASLVNITVTKPVYAMSSVDMKPKKAVKTGDTYTLDLTLANGCYIVATDNMTVTSANVIQAGSE